MACWVPLAYGLMGLPVDHHLILADCIHGFDNVGERAIEDRKPDATTVDGDHEWVFSSYETRFDVAQSFLDLLRDRVSGG